MIHYNPLKMVLVVPRKKSSLKFNLISRNLALFFTYFRICGMCRRWYSWHFPLFGIEEKGKCRVRSDAAHGECCQKVLFEEYRYIGIGGESVAIEDVDYPRVGFIVDRIGEYVEGEVCGGGVRDTHIVLDERTELVECHASGIGIIPLVKQFGVTGRCGGDIYVCTIDIYINISDSRCKKYA